MKTKTTAQMPMLPALREIERAILRKDADFDGVFYFAVKTTGVFCRPSCPSRPLSKNLEYFAAAEDCLAAGYRPCKRCQPEFATGAQPPWVTQLIAQISDSAKPRLGAAELRPLGITPERARRWFVQHYGMTFTAWCRSYRLGLALRRIQNGASLDDAASESGFESLSGFRDAFARTFSAAPGKAAASLPAAMVKVLDSPYGPLCAAASDSGLRVLEFAPQPPEASVIEQLRRSIGSPCVIGDHPVLESLEAQLTEYFKGSRAQFNLPLNPSGTPFQKQVWELLRAIPHGETISYGALARRIGRPTAQRAVAQANRANPIAILIPCHRVIGKDGTLAGYAGGLWRKRLLLQLEAANHQR